MGMDQSFIVACWDRPLEELAFNREQPEPAVADEDISWARKDGWQCFAPWDVYDAEMADMVVQIEGETGSPILVMEVVDSDSWHVAFSEGAGCVMSAMELWGTPTGYDGAADLRGGYALRPSEAVHAGPGSRGSELVDSHPRSRLRGLESGSLHPRSLPSRSA